MVKEYFYLYLIYGFAMINMGIFSIKQNNTKLTNIALVKSLKYLGWFGIIHGLSEWITMIIVVDIYPDLVAHLFNLNQILKSLSFAFLMYFGFDLLPLSNKKKRIVLKIPIILFAIFSAGYIVLVNNNGFFYHQMYPKYNIVSMRYFMALSSALISAVALCLNAKFIKETKSIEISRGINSLACIFLIYGLLEGLIVQDAYFFPANTLNRELFTEYFRFSPLFIKAVVGLVINYLLIQVIDTFSWEQEEKLKKLEEHRISSEERRKLGLEIHDSIIQGLYAAGLKIEYLSLNKDQDDTRNILEEVKSDLNTTINQTREFLSTSALEKIELEDLSENLKQLVQKCNENQKIKINLRCEISPLNLGYLSPEKSTQIYYIVQEAISNVIKHSKASSAEVILEGRSEFLDIKVIDNGIGLSRDKLRLKKHFGICSMKERTERVGGLFIIEKLKMGTQIQVHIPWEV